MVNYKKPKPSKKLWRIDLRTGEKVNNGRSYAEYLEIHKARIAPIKEKHHLEAKKTIDALREKRGRLLTRGWDRRFRVLKTL